MSDGMKTVNLIEKVLDYECSVDDAITIETMMFKTMRSEIEELHLELARYKQGVEVEGTVEQERIYIDFKTPLNMAFGQRVRVLVIPEEG